MITKFMGETAAKLNLVFQSMRRTRGVYLFDEFDAIGAHRNASNDVGEARRVLNSFLMFLEQDTTGSVVLAATNLAQVLDEALFRRFDDVIIFSKPDASRVRLLVANRLAEFKLGKLAWNRIVAAARGLSHAEIVRACEDAAKEAVLSHRATIRSEELVRALRGRTPTSQR